MFAANAQLDVGTGLLAELNSHLDEFAYAVLINACKGIALEDLLFIIVFKELPGIVAAEALKVIWVRSLVPKLKNSASVATSSAVRAARGISIMVPTR